jgi:[ribosomal protein S5]-alanine N-acetyltransferase
MKRIFRKTKRLIIRPLELADYEIWHKALTTMDPPKNKWDKRNRSSKELKLSKYKKILATQKINRQEDRYYDCAVFERSSNKMVGIVNIMDVQRSISQNAYIGYAIFNPYWGQGYGKEAVRAMMEIGFKDLKIHRLEAGIEASNRRSILLARALGMRREGLKKRIVYLRKTWVDLVMYAATCEDFKIPWKGIAEPRHK